MVLSHYLKSRRHLRKILIVGSGAVGKTSLLFTLKDGKILSQKDPSVLEYHRTPFLELDTINAGFLIQNDTNGVFQFYDVAGQLDLPIHPLRDLTDTVLGSVDLIILVFAQNNMQSLLDLSQWLSIVTDLLKSSCDVSPDFILIKNKIDLESVIDQSLIENILHNENRIIKNFDISCMTGDGIQDLKNWIVKQYFSA